jgi:hypothetical protein
MRQDGQDGRRASELADDLGESLWLVEGDEGVAVGYLDQSCVRAESGEAPAVVGRHNAVLTGPDDQRRPPEAPGPAPGQSWSSS